MLNSPHSQISIHALLAESDGDVVYNWLPYAKISIHALLAESDHGGPVVQFNVGTFLSTLSLRRATHHQLMYRNLGRHFYPRSPCGERRCARCRCWGLSEISIHALLAESDRRITITVDDGTIISIHALLAESDISYQYISPDFWDFYPRSPCGERHAHLYYHSRGLNISIHALLAESDYIS